MYMHGLSDNSGDYVPFEANFPTDASIAADNAYVPFEANFPVDNPSAAPIPAYSPSGLPNIGSNSTGAAQGGSPSWSSLLQTAMSTYNSTQQAKAAQSIAQARNTAQPTDAPLYRYPSTYPAGYSPFPAVATGSGPLGLSTTGMLALAGVAAGLYFIVAR